MHEPTERLGTELFSIPLDRDRYLLYAPLHRLALVGNGALVNTIARCRENVPTPHAASDPATLRLLRRLGLLTRGPDGPSDNPPGDRYCGPPAPSCLTLLLTNRCNLRCTYCYASTGAARPRTMDLAVAKRGIDFVSQCVAAAKADEFELAYHGGGEPTTAWAVLVQSCEYASQRARELGISLKAAAATNGLLTRDQVAWIVAHLNGGLSVSFDGLPAVHDRHRRTSDGRGSAERVVQTLQLLDDAGYSYGIRVTVTSDQVARLPESVEYICRNFRPLEVQAEPVYLLGRGADAGSVDVQQFLTAFRAARDIAEYYGVPLRFSAARPEVLTRHFCGITRDSFALTCDGNVTACYEVFSESHPLADEFFYGKWDSAAARFIFGESALEKLRAQTVDGRARCRSCFAKWHCAGDCYHKSLLADRQLDGGGTDRCLVTQELIKDELLMRIQASGGLLWYEPVEATVSAERVLQECP